jgi:RNA-binding protein
MLRRLRGIAHHLNPVVSIGDAGVSAAVIAETQRALTDHELIKVKIHSESRESRQALAAELIEHCGAEKIQSIGKVLVLYRANPKANPELSNLARHDTKGGR